MAPRGGALLGALDGLPPEVTLLFALVTQLGDPWFVFAALTLLYWLGDGRLSTDPRRTGAVLVAAGVAALALTTGLKTLFALPRPPGAGSATPPGWLPAALVPAFVDAATADGFGFPSGHALGTTMVYGGLAALLDRLRRRPRVAAALTVVALVSVSRLVLGVHYLLDVVVGVLVGLAGLAVLLRVARRDPVRAFAVGAVLAALALAVAALGGHAAEAHEAGIGFGTALGGALAWRRVGDALASTPPVSPGAAAAGLPVVGAGWVGVYAADLPLPATVPASAVVVAVLVAYPVLVDR